MPQWPEITSATAIACILYSRKFSLLHEHLLLVLRKDGGIIEHVKELLFQQFQILLQLPGIQLVI